MVYLKDGRLQLFIIHYITRPSIHFLFPQGVGAKSVFLPLSLTFLYHHCPRPCSTYHCPWPCTIIVLDLVIPTNDLALVAPNTDLDLVAPTIVLDQRVVGWRTGLREGAHDVTEGGATVETEAARTTRHRADDVLWRLHQPEVSTGQKIKELLYLHAIHFNFIFTVLFNHNMDYESAYACEFLNLSSPSYDFPSWCWASGSWQAFFH